MGLSRSPLTTFCFELHRSWRQLRTASAGRLALCLSLLAGIRSVLASTAHQRAIQDVSDARDDLADAFLELRIEAAATTRVTLRALRYTLRWLPSSLHQVWIDKGVPSTSPASPVSGASLSLGRPEYFDVSGQMGRSSGWTLEDLEHLRSSPHIYGYPQRFVVGNDQPIDSKEWLEAITTWPNPILDESQQTVLTVEGTGEPWVAPEKWDAAKVAVAEGWDRNVYGWPVPDPEMVAAMGLHFDETPPFDPYRWYPADDVIQFPKPEPPSRAIVLLAALMNDLREAGLLREDLPAPEGTEEVQG